MQLARRRPRDGEREQRCEAEHAAREVSVDGPVRELHDGKDAVEEGAAPHPCEQPAPDVDAPLQAAERHAHRRSPSDLHNEAQQSEHERETGDREVEWPRQALHAAVRLVLAEVAVPLQLEGGTSGGGDAREAAVGDEPAEGHICTGVAAAESASFFFVECRINTNTRTYSHP